MMSTIDSSLMVIVLFELGDRLLQQCEILLLFIVLVHNYCVRRG